MISETVFNNVISNLVSANYESYYLNENDIKEIIDFTWCVSENGLTKSDFIDLVNDVLEMRLDTK
jgi:hypothetical protein